MTSFTTERVRPLTLLRRVLALDAVVTAGNGVIYLVASGPVERLLGVSSGLLVGLGALLAGYGLAVGYLATREALPASAVQAVVTANTGWAVASLAVLTTGWLDLTTAGLVWVPTQAAVVAGFAALQGIALRRWRSAG